MVFQQDFRWNYSTLHFSIQYLFDFLKGFVIYNFKTFIDEKSETLIIIRHEFDLDS